MITQKKQTKVIIGGTFDILHRGHHSLLKKAFSLGDWVTIGLTSNQMAKKRKKREVRDFLLRKKDLVNFIEKKLQASQRYKIVKINDEFGPALKEDFDYIVVSPETYNTAVLINQKRRQKKKKPIKIIKIKFVRGENGQPISSTKLRAQKKK